jgi:hypothetical protein
VTLPAGNIPDDAIMPTSTSGTFYISNQGGNDVISVQVTGLNTNDLYADIANQNELVQIDPKTGAITPIVTGLNNPHGLEFVPSVSDPSEFNGTVAGLTTDPNSSGDTGGAPTVGDGNHTANVALLANYMASSFATSSDSHGGTLVSDTATTQQPLLTHPHA